MKKLEFGFSLIELMIVVAIIGILSVIGLASFSRIQVSSRDLKRESDLKSIQGALEQYYADQHYYPQSVTFGNGASLTGPSNRVYLNQIPDDPVSTQHYFYGAMHDSTNGCTNSLSPLDPSTFCLRYCIYANLENSANAVNNTTTSAACSKSGYNFAVSQQ